MNMRTHLRYVVLAALHRAVDLAVLVELDIMTLCLFGPHLELAEVDCKETVVDQLIRCRQERHKTDAHVRRRQKVWGYGDDNSGLPPVLPSPKFPEPMTLTSRTSVGMIPTTSQLTQWWQFGDGNNGGQVASSAGNSNSNAQLGRRHPACRGDLTFNVALVVRTLPN